MCTWRQISFLKGSKSGQWHHHRIFRTRARSWPQVRFATINHVNLFFLYSELTRETVLCCCSFLFSSHVKGFTLEMRPNQKKNKKIKIEICRIAPNVWAVSAEHAHFTRFIRFLFLHFHRFAVRLSLRVRVSANGIFKYICGFFFAFKVHSTFTSSNGAMSNTWIFVYRMRCLAVDRLLPDSIRCSCAIWYKVDYTDNTFTHTHAMMPTRKWGARNFDNISTDLVCSLNRRFHLYVVTSQGKQHSANMRKAENLYRNKIRTRVFYMKNVAFSSAQFIFVIFFSRFVWIQQ